MQSGGTSDIHALFAKRLSQARRMAGLSLRELSDKMQPSVSYNALHKYESGEMLPESGILLSLAQALVQPVDFFFRPMTVNLETIEFRKKSKLTPKQIEAIREQATDFFERYLQVEQALGLDTHFGNPLANRMITQTHDVEHAVESLRDQWKLGWSPLSNVVELLEHRHIKVLLHSFDPGFDGFSGWSGNTPVIVLNSSFSKDRIRFTALHELGHLLLKFDSSFDEKEIEKLCHRFAGAMLLPEQVFKEEFGGYREQISLEELKDIKEDYGISIAAIMMRARDLEYVSDSLLKHFWKLRMAKGWDKNEPGDYTGEAFPNRFDQLLHRAAATEALSLSLAASLGKIKLADFREGLQFIP